MRRRVFSTLVLTGLLFSAACTPRPDVADDTAEKFLQDLASHSKPGDLTDNAATANDAIDQSWDKLQAEGLATHLDKVDTNGNTATAHYSMDWDLPGDRHMRYGSTMTLTKSGSKWTVRWQPSVLHPALGANQHLELRAVPAQTASVVGSDGAVLLAPGSAYRVLVDTKKVKDVRGTLDRVAAQLDGLRATDPAVPRIDPAALAAEAKGVNGQFSVVTLGEVQGPKLAAALAGFDGVRVNQESALVRPDPGFAPDIMSRVSTLVDKDLQGANGWKVAAVTANGAEVKQLDGADPNPAPAVHVSLAKNVQDAAQAAVDTRGDAKAMMVVLRPSTGEVLAVAQTAKADEDGNVALMGQYPPGSTFKILTAYAGLSHQDLSPDSTVNCPGTQNIGGRVVTNYNGFSLGTTTLQRAFAASCNTTFANVSSGLAPGQLAGVASQFGLGVDFTIDGLDTFTGSVPRGDVLLDRTEAGYGQGLDLASPFGMALVSATAQRGSMPTPYLISGGNHQTRSKNQAAQPLDPGKVDQLRSMMRAVVTTGTARGIAGSGEVFGKTGEAEVNNGSHAWFTGYRGDLAFATLIVYGGGSESAVSVTNHFFANMDKGPDQGSPAPAAEG
ncbi:penicillin-binding transpeptidase domain-containing protein [Corynebacterium heidelbergense]|uniref:Cell division protein FtsI n=1 Tax=Corynebacterium heidelbergense TaxID=2055947 RepID=A0A364V9H4_9CORY|nr:penicillin-binding transpeptidase domain-containing protein [Corynebacterium heidelbergense]RAV33264.1 cell division protein FtsI [Corynebacterium heidelbergense]WCZ36745.1 Stage V sporulation protein D [Corynebacterium heidelbergense]